MKELLEEKEEKLGQMNQQASSKNIINWDEMTDDDYNSIEPIK